MGRVLSTPPRRSARVLIGLYATSRYLGFAILVEGILVGFETKRLDKPRRSGTLASFVEGELRDLEPDVVVVVRGDDLRRYVGDVPSDRRTVEIDPERVGRVIGVGPTRAAICRELARRHPLIASRVKFSRVQSDSHRYHEAAVIAAGAVLTVFAEFSSL